MARRRKHKGLPPNVYKANNGGYQLIIEGTYVGMVGGKDATLEEVQRNADAKRKLNQPYSLRSLIEHYKKSEEYAENSADTKRCKGYSEKQVLAVFKGDDCRKLKTHQVQRWYNERRRHAKSRVNKEIAFLSVVFGLAVSEGLMNTNPCIGVRKKHNPPRRRYVTDGEYQALVQAASPMMSAAIQLAYLTGLRQTDILNLKWSQVKNDEIDVDQSKTDVEIAKSITPAVRAALDLAKSDLCGVRSVWVIHTKGGQKYTRDGFQANFRRVKKAANLVEPQFRDLRKKGATDYEGRTRDFTGHTTDAIAERVYNLNRRKSPSLDN